MRAGAVTARSLATSARSASRARTSRGDATRTGPARGRRRPSRSRRARSTAAKPSRSVMSSPMNIGRRPANGGFGEERPDCIGLGSGPGLHLEDAVALEHVIVVTQSASRSRGSRAAARIPARARPDSAARASVPCPRPACRANGVRARQAPPARPQVLAHAGRRAVCVRPRRVARVRAGRRPATARVRTARRVAERAAADQRDGAIEGIPDTKQQSLQ